MIKILDESIYKWDSDRQINDDNPYDGEYVSNLIEETNDILLKTKDILNNIKYDFNYIEYPQILALEQFKDLAEANRDNIKRIYEFIAKA